MGVSTAGSSTGTGRAHQRRSALTEQRIVSAAGELFVQDGYAATTMAAIAGRAGVAAARR
jgi:AcrR family transcriptional regulator